MLSLPPPDDLPAQSRQRSRSLGRPRSKAIAKAGAILRGASWAEAQSDDETDRQLQQAYGRRHRAKAPGATRPRGATPRGEGDAQASGSASASAGAATPHANVRSEVADAREYVNAQSFARDAQRTSPLQDIARCQPPSLIWRSGDFELWLGGVHHVLDRKGANVRHYTILVDCLGDVHQRAFDPARFANTSWVEVPWNYRGALALLHRVLGPPRCATPSGRWGQDVLILQERRAPKCSRARRHANVLLRLHC